MRFQFPSDDCAHIWAEADYIEFDAAIDYWCEGDPRCRLAKKEAIFAACEHRLVRWERSDGKDFNDPVRELAARGLLLIERASFETWAAAVGEKIPLPPSMSTREANGLRRQVGALAMLLASRDGRYCKPDGTPSANAIADDVARLLDEHDRAHGRSGWDPANRAGVSSSSVRQNIAEGYKELLG